MVAATSIDAEISIKSLRSSNHNRASRTNNNKMGMRCLLFNGHDSISERSFRKLPDEEPLFIWNTDEAETHIQRMRALDKKLAKYEEQIRQLKDDLRKEDESCEAQLDAIQKREQRARDDTARYQEQSEQAEQTATRTNLQVLQLQGKLTANTHKIQELRNDGKKLTKDLKRAEKIMEKVAGHNSKLEACANNLLSTLSDLNSSFEFSGRDLMDIVQDSKEEHAEYTAAVRAMHDRYMNEATQRLEMQKCMADILTMIQSACTDPKLSNACTRLALDCEKRSNQLMAELEAAEEAAAA